MRISIAGAIRQAAFLAAGLVAAASLNAPAHAMDVFEDFFTDLALEPSFSRDFRGVSMGGYWIEATGQDPGISYNHLGATSDLWNDEHNQVLAGMQYRRHVFDREVVLPDGTTLPSRINAASASILYKHITEKDWSVSQSIRYTRIAGNSLSEPGTDRVDLVGSAVVSPKPGYAWVFGYLWSQEGYLDAAGNRKIERPVPIIEFCNASHEDYNFILGFPILGFNYYPHPDWGLGLNWALGSVPAASASYKIRERDRVRLSYGGDSWAYKVTADEKEIRYRSHRLAVDWTHSQLIRGRPVKTNLVIGRELDRRLGLLGSNNKLLLDDATIIGLNLAFSF